MEAILRNLRSAPIPPPVSDQDEGFNLEYSMALEYIGPPPSYKVPHAEPVDLYHIPTAAVAVSAALLHNSSLPVIEPIAKTKPVGKKREIGREALINSTSSDRVGISEIELEVPDNGEEGEGFENYMNPKDWESTESGLSSRSLSSDAFFGKEEEEERATEAPQHVRKPSVVTFRDPDSNDIVEEESWSQSKEDESNTVKQRAERTGKKGSCYRCEMGSRFTQKEVCIVCCAKYCYYCVLRAMGSMPEGRKCVTCIGYRIDESRRGKLGKCSSLLKRLLPDLEVEQIMKSEILCKANQLPSNLVYVNSEALSPEELVRLQSCKNPPRKLKPGSYWYDNVSGFWGKEGQVYSQIISPQLSIGGHIKRNASNGNTNILINNREITKVELRILQLAGVPCEGKLHYWVNPDGSYQEEGMNKIKGNMWNKAAVKLVCAVLQLPIPRNSSDSSTEEGDRALPNSYEDQVLRKILLVGSDQSGTSTIFKQAKLLYNVPFSEEERQNMKILIQSKLYSYLAVLLEGREQFEEECLINKRKRQPVDQPGPSGNAEQNDETTIYSIGPRLKAFADWLLKIVASGNLDVIFPAATREYAPFVEDLWNDAAIQETYDRRNDFEMLPRAATYFLNRAVEISRTDYEPSDMDILYAEGIASSNCVTSMEFSYPKIEQESILDAPQHNPLLRYQLIRVHPNSLGENCKWLQMFEDVDIVLFSIALSDYDEFSVDSNGVLINKMMASRLLFESIVTNPSFEKKQFLLILNKFDLLEEKINQVPLSQCEWFNDFHPVMSNNPNSSNNNSNNPTLAHRAFQHIAMKFKRLFRSLTDDRKLFVSLVTGLESDTVDEALRYAGEILKWAEEKPKLIADNQVSTTSVEVTSSTL